MYKYYDGLMGFCSDVYLVKLVMLPVMNGQLF